MVTVSQSQPCGEASADAEVFAGLAAELAAAAAMLDRYDAPTDDEGDGGGPLSLAGRIEAMVYRDALGTRETAHRLMTRDQIMEAALTEIARLRTELRGDFSMGSRQSDIARKALRAAPAGPESGQLGLKTNQDEPDYKTLFLSVREALEPFAKFYNDLDKLQLITGGTMPHDSKCIATVAHAGVGARIELGDFRRASTALSVGGGVGKREDISSVAGLPAHVADATATETQHSTGKED